MRQFQHLCYFLANIICDLGQDKTSSLCLASLIVNLEIIKALISSDCWIDYTNESVTRSQTVVGT